MSKSAYTPTPWQTDGEDFIFANGLSQDPILQVRGWGWLNKEHGSDKAQMIQKANLEFTCKAVNHHQELITRLYNLVNACETMNVHIEFTTIELSVKEARETLKKVIQ